jgi:hypothetical protein
LRPSTRRDAPANAPPAQPFPLKGAGNHPSRPGGGRSARDSRVYRLSPVAPPAPQQHRAGRPPFPLEIALFSRCARRGAEAAAKPKLHRPLSLAFLGS